MQCTFLGCKIPLIVREYVADSSGSLFKLESRKGEQKLL